ncbi:MAG: hypothetical protein WC276_08090 [Sedimentibacter sp.]
MLNMVKGFNDLTSEFYSFAGGKGGMLAKMFQGGYPVPEGFVIFPSAFKEETLNNNAWNEILVLLNKIRKTNKGAMFAVRSSALSEDSAEKYGGKDFAINAKG